MESEYLIAVIHKATKKAVEWAPGLAVEKEFEQEFLDRLSAKGVGRLRSTSHVIADARSALRELLHDLKSQV